MKIHCLTDRPDRDLGLALKNFEKEFSYPLGAGQSFSISHGEDYTLFFRSMGKATTYLAEIGGNIVGALTVVQRTAVFPDGSLIPTIYLCDAKVSAAHRGRTVLGRLALKARDDVRAEGYNAAYSVVMKGSTPTDIYTGRIGIPPFKAIGRLAILQFDTASKFKPTASYPAGRHEKFYQLKAANSSISSEIEPLPLEVDGACGLLVDTRLGKRLWQSDGHEICSAHLTRLIFHSAKTLSDLIESAVTHTQKIGISKLFVSIPDDDSALVEYIKSTAPPPTLSRATIFGTGLPEGKWMVDTSEI